MAVDVSRFKSGHSQFQIRPPRVKTGQYPYLRRWQPNILRLRSLEESIMNTLQATDTGPQSVAITKLPFNCWQAAPTATLLAENDLLTVCYFASSGSFAIFTAISRASSPVWLHWLVRNGPETQQHQADDDEREDSR